MAARAEVSRSKESARQPGSTVRVGVATHAGELSRWTALQLLCVKPGGVMRQILLTTIVPILLFSSSTAGQQAPDLTGTWVMDVTRSASAANAGHVPADATAEVLIVRQSGEALVIERRRGTASEVISYSFNKEDRAAAGGRPSTLPRPQGGPPDRPVGTSGNPPTSIRERLGERATLAKSCSARKSGTRTLK